MAKMRPPDIYPAKAASSLPETGWPTRARLILSLAAHLDVQAFERQTAAISTRRALSPCSPSWRFAPVTVAKGWLKS